MALQYASLHKRTDKIEQPLPASDELQRHQVVPGNHVPEIWIRLSGLGLRLVDLPHQVIRPQQNLDWQASELVPAKPAQP